MKTNFFNLFFFFFFLTEIFLFSTFSNDIANYHTTKVQMNRLAGTSEYTTKRSSYRISEKNESGRTKQIVRWNFTHALDLPTHKQTKKTVSSALVGLHLIALSHKALCFTMVLHCLTQWRIIVKPQCHTVHNPKKLIPFFDLISSNFFFFIRELGDQELAGQNSDLIDSNNILFLDPNPFNITFFD